MAGEMLEQQRSELLRHLIRCIVVNAGKSLEAVGRGDELSGPLGRSLPTVSSASPQMYKVGTAIGPSGCRSPRARYQASAASIAGGLPMTEKGASIAASGTPELANRLRIHLAWSARSRGPAPGSRNSLWCRDGAPVPHPA